ncbi:MAG TPA: hypothetical protein VNL92_02670, partial [Dehalococcoidia bacterium]|nr:hypothetical protein [Dehalococcoidia bacterium]
LVVSGGGLGRVRIRLDGKASTLRFGSGSYTVTDPEGTISLLVGGGGLAEIEFILNGIASLIEVGDGGSITYTETTNEEGEVTGFEVKEVEGDVTLNDQPLAGPVELVGPPMKFTDCSGRSWMTFNYPRTFRNAADCQYYVFNSLVSRALSRLR